eukprot:Trichotokara_eunicae@DN4785_c0_g1_i3.p1
MNSPISWSSFQLVLQFAYGFLAFTCLAALRWPLTDQLAHGFCSRFQRAPGESVGVSIEKARRFFLAAEDFAIAWIIYIGANYNTAFVVAWCLSNGAVTHVALRHQHSIVQFLSQFLPPQQGLVDILAGGVIAACSYRGSPMLDNIILVYSMTVMLNALRQVVLSMKARRRISRRIVAACLQAWCVFSLTNAFRIGFGIVIACHLLVDPDYLNEELIRSRFFAMNERDPGASWLWKLIM